MRTHYYGDTIRHNADHKHTQRMTHKQVDYEREPRGDDMAVFDRSRSTGYDCYERPYRPNEDDAVWVRRGR